MIAEFHLYEPEPSMYESILTAYQKLSGPVVGCLVEPDPLGPVNKIATLVVDGRRIKSVLWRIPAGADVQIRRAHDGWTIDELFSLRSRMWDTRGQGEPEPQIEPPRMPGWCIEIDGHEVLYVPDCEIWPRPTAPAVPWRERTRRAVRSTLRTRARKVGDAIAHRFGYIHEDEASSW